MLYRRWAKKDQLVLAAIEHYRHARPVETPDTGTLRGDLLVLLTAMSKARATFTAIAAAAGFSGLLADTGLTPASARQDPRRPVAVARSDHLPTRPRPR